MRLQSRLLAGGLCVGLALAMAGCGDDGDTGSDTGSGAGGGGNDQVKVGVIPILDVAPIYLGQQEGFFEEEGIDLSLETGQGGAAIVPGVASGQFQFGFSNNTSLLIATSEGLPLQVVAAGNSTTGEPGNDFGAVVVGQDSPMEDAADLEGAKVAVNTLNNIGSTTINKVVRDAGGDPTTIEYVELAFPDMPAALESGQVDAAWVVEPFLTITTSSGARPVAWNFAETDPELQIATYFTSAETAESDPDLVERFTAAMNRSLEYAAENPDAVVEVLGSYTELDPELAAQLILPRFTTEISEDSFDLLAELAVEDGVFDEAPDTSTLLP